MFSSYVGVIGDQFFFLSTDSTYSRVPGDKVGLIFFRLDFFSALVLRTNWCTTMCITCPILCKIVQLLCKIECNKFVCNEFVLVLVQIDLIQFKLLSRKNLSPITLRTQKTCRINTRDLRKHD